MPVEKTNSRAPDLPHRAAVINVGLPAFGEAVRAQGAEAIDVDWRIPGGEDPELVACLQRLYGRGSERIDDANTEVVRRLDQGAPVLVGVGEARREVPGMEDHMILHCGPPLAWDEFCDPLRRSVRAAVVAEGWAASLEEADALVGRGRALLEPANHHATVLPMAGALGPTAPVVVVDNPQGGNRALSGINQGPGKVAWFGVDAPEAIERLVWLREVMAPVLDACLRDNPVDLLALASQGLQMGDDVHMRSQASTNLLIRDLLPRLAALDDPRRQEVARFLAGNHLFFLNLSMAAAKALTDWAGAVKGSSVVVGMARNGTTFGVRLTGAQERWFVARAPAVEDALYNADFGPDDAAPDIGDSAVLELVGLGGPAAAACPSVAAFVGGTIAGAVGVTEAMDTVCVGRSSRFKVPFLDFRGTPLAVDVRKVVELGITPSINTGILHSSSGHGQIGAGVARAPVECFQEAMRSLAHDGE
jgi:hypothetical protein